MRSAFIILCLSFALSLRAQHRAEFTTSIASNLNQSIIQQWLHHNSAALKTVYGGLPNKPFQIRVQGTHWSWENVPGGRVSRGNINTIHFTVNTRASLQDLKSDWTAYHEFSHLLLPYRGWGDLWFSEGLASYYQNVIQARSGQITAQQAWQKIVAGFARGRRSNPAPHLPLHDVSAQLRRNHAYYRVYWSGAWYFLTADIRLRAKGQNKSLDGALLHLDNCCAKRTMSARQLAVEMDRYAQSEIFVPLFERIRNSKTMPFRAAFLQDLGLHATQGTYLPRGGKYVKLRDAIMATGE